MKGERRQRVGMEVQRVLADLLRGEADERGPLNVSVTGVTVSGDLRNATVHFSFFLRPERPEEIEGLLNGLAPRLRHQLARTLNLRHTPMLDFRWDGSLEYGDRINRLLGKLSDE